jgi:hypothetical protein
MPIEGRPNGTFTRGGPSETYLQPGHPWRYPKGTSGNPGGFTKRRAEFERLQREALKDPELLKKSMVKLGEAIDQGEPWAVQWYLNRVWPDRPAGFTMMAGVSVEGENADAIFEAFYRRIAECSARIAASGDSEDAAVGTGGADGVPVEVLGPTESTGA